MLKNWEVIMGKKFIGMKTRRVKIISIVKRSPVKGRNKMSVNLKHVGKPIKSLTTEKASVLRSKGYWNAMVTKGSFVWSVKKVKLTKAQRKALKKLTPAQRRARRRKKYKKLEETISSPNPANVEIGKRIL